MGFNPEDARQFSERFLALVPKGEDPNTYIPSEIAKLGFGRQSPKNGLRMMIEETERVAARLDDTLGNRVDNLYLLLGMVPNTTRRIATELDRLTSQDHCAAFHASCLVTSAIGAFLLLRRGLIVEAATLTRSTLEVAAQAILFLRDSASAEKWIKGKCYSPKEVRKKLGNNPNLGDLYRDLSNVAHANPQARWLHSVNLPGSRYAIAYGGNYQPKGAATLVKVLGDIVLLYLESFYDHYKEQLSIQFWPPLLQLSRAMNNDLSRWADSLTADSIALTNHFSQQKSPPPMSSPQSYLMDFWREAGLGTIDSPVETEESE